MQPGQRHCGRCGPKATAHSMIQSMASEPNSKQMTCHENRHDDKHEGVRAQIVTFYSFVSGIGAMHSRYDQWSVLSSTPCSRDMDEHVLAAGVRLNETMALGRVEHFTVPLAT